MVYEPHPDPAWVYVLASGLVWQYRTPSAGAPVALGLVVPGEVFGEAALFEAPVDHVAEAVRSSVVWEVPRRSFLAAVEQHPAEGYELARQLQSRSRRLVDRLESLALRHVKGRFAHLLLDLAASLGPGHEESGSVELPFSQGELACWIGTTRQTVSTLLAQLGEEGLVQRSGRRLRLRDVARLRALADGDDGAHRADEAVS